MEERYSRNWIYVSEAEQNLLKKYRIILGGAGIGSIIAECAIRFGFESITIVDGDRVELSNLNRQNYDMLDVGKYKAECLSKRLLNINPSASINYHNCFINKDNVESLIRDHDVAINALDFTSDIPFVFDNICEKFNISVLHPYNFGWAGFLTIVKPDGIKLSQLASTPERFDLEVAKYVTHYGNFWNMPKNWLEQVIDTYQKEYGISLVPQLSVGSWIAAGHCVHALYNLATGRELKFFPKFYLSSIFYDNH